MGSFETARKSAFLSGTRDARKKAAYNKSFDDERIKMANEAKKAATQKTKDDKVAETSPYGRRDSRVTGGKLNATASKPTVVGFKTRTADGIHFSFTNRNVIPDTEEVFSGAQKGIPMSETAPKLKASAEDMRRAGVNNQAIISYIDGVEGVYMSKHGPVKPGLDEKSLRKSLLKERFGISKYDSEKVETFTSSVSNASKFENFKGKILASYDKYKNLDIPKSDFAAHVLTDALDPDDIESEAEAVMLTGKAVELFKERERMNIEQEVVKYEQVTKRGINSNIVADIHDQFSQMPNDPVEFWKALSPVSGAVMKDSERDEFASRLITQDSTDVQFRNFAQTKVDKMKQFNNASPGKQQRMFNDVIINYMRQRLDNTQDPDQQIWYADLLQKLYEQNQSDAGISNEFSDVRKQMQSAFVKFNYGKSVFEEMVEKEKVKVQAAVAAADKPGHNAVVREVGGKAKVVMYADTADEAKELAQMSQSDFDAKKGFMADKAKSGTIKEKSIAAMNSGLIRVPFITGNKKSGFDTTPRWITPQNKTHFDYYREEIGQFYSAFPEHKMEALDVLDKLEENWDHYEQQRILDEKGSAADATKLAEFFAQINEVEDAKKLPKDLKLSRGTVKAEEIAGEGFAYDIAEQKGLKKGGLISNEDRDERRAAKKGK